MLACFLPVMRQQFRLCGCPLGFQGLHGCSDLTVSQDTLALEQAVAGSVSDQGMAKRKQLVGAVVAPMHKLRAHQVVERIGQLGRRQAQHRVQQSSRELAPDHRAYLRYLLGRRQIVQSRHQRILQRRRDRQGWQWPAQAVATGCCVQQARLEHRFGQFLYEQRNAVGLADDLGQHFVGQRLATGDRTDQFGCLALAEAVQCQPRQIGRVAPGRHVLGAAGHQEQQPAVA